jgi:hypothetical protein
MYPKSKTKRNKYERSRRFKIQKDRQIDQVLRPWLEIKYKEVFEEFFAFYKHLSENNPQAKNFTKTNEFRVFVAGMFLYYVICISNLYLHFYLIYFRTQTTDTAGFKSCAIQAFNTKDQSF